MDGFLYGYYTLLEDGHIGAFSLMKIWVWEKVELSDI